MKIGEDAVLGCRSGQVIMAAGPSGPHFPAQHAQYHLRVTRPPGGQSLVDLGEFLQEDIGLMEDGLVAIQVDEQGGHGGPVRETQLALRPHLLVLVRIGDRQDIVLIVLEDLQAHGLGFLAEQGCFHDGLPFALHHAPDRTGIAFQEVEIAKVQEGGSLQPLFDGGEDSAMGLQVGQDLLLLIPEDDMVGLLVVGQALAAGQAEHGLDLAELIALEAGSREEMVTEIQEIEGCHGLHHQDLLDEQLLDLDHPVEAGNGQSEVAFVDGPLGEEIAHRAHVVNDLLEPELVHLVDNDEQHFIVGRLACFFAHQLLAVQEFVELEIAVIMNGGIGLPVAHVVCIWSGGKIGTISRPPNDP